MAKYCVECGRELTGGKYCRFCGCNQTKQNPVERRKKLLAIVLVAGIIIIVTAVLLIMTAHVSRTMEIVEHIREVGAD